MSLKDAALKAFERNRLRNMSATDAATGRNFSCDSNTSKVAPPQPQPTAEVIDFDRRIHAMATRWKYAADELIEALQLAAADREGWRRLVEHDEAKLR
jgi:hypothetical protein